jgi:hypothetical protein
MISPFLRVTRRAVWIRHDQEKIVSLFEIEKMLYEVPMFAVIDKTRWQKHAVACIPSAVHVNAVWKDALPFSLAEKGQGLQIVLMLHASKVASEERRTSLERTAGDYFIAPYTCVRKSWR